MTLALAGHFLCQNAKRSRAEYSPASRFDRWQQRSVEPLQRSVERLTVTESGDDTERARRISVPGIDRIAPRPVNLQRTCLLQ